VRISKLLRGWIFSLHSSIARNKLTARFYLWSCILLLKNLPSSRFKRRAIFVLSSIKWPITSFKPQLVRVGESTNMMLIPHRQEFDFETLFVRSFSYEKEVFSLLEKRIQMYDAIIEIGANIGIYTIFFGKQFQRLGKSVPIFSFEPSLEAFYRLQQNLRNNNLNDDINIFNCAVSDKSGLVEFFEPEDHLTNGSLLFDFANKFGLNVTTMKVLSVGNSELTELIKHKQKLLLKMDVEGAEARLVIGLQKLIEEKQPDILIEVLPAFQDELNQLSYLLESYNLYSITNGELTEQKRFIANTSSRDYLLLPKH